MGELGKVSESTWVVVLRLELVVCLISPNEFLVVLQ